MDGIHDMGGMHGFGPVRPEDNEPVFHADWEARVLAINRAMGFTRTWNGDLSRYAKEVIPPDVYLASSYYKRWTIGLEWLTMKYGLVDADEFAAGRALRPGKLLARVMSEKTIGEVLVRKSYERPAKTEALFAIGDRVRTKFMHTDTHTRLPRYVRGHVGTVESVHGCQVYPDSNARGEGDDPQWLYTVRFDGRDLWGAEGDPTLVVSIDAFEPYLEHA